jgi:hypothetical protein
MACRRNLTPARLAFSAIDIIYGAFAQSLEIWEGSMRVLSAVILALIIGSSINSVQAASSGHIGRWCMVSGSDNTRHCYFRRHRDCMNAIADGSAACVPNEKRRGEMPEDKSK